MVRYLLLATLVLLAPFPATPLHALSQDGRMVRDLICRKHVRFTAAPHTLTYGHLRMGKYVYYEEGQTELLRTGYEVALFQRLKQRFRQSAPPLEPKQVFLETIDAIVDVNRIRNPNGPWSLNIPTILLTGYNVTRLLARPEQWSLETFDPARNLQMTGYGQNRFASDPAFPIILDLMGVASVDTGPTTMAIAKITRFDHNYIYEAFYGQNRVFLFFNDAVMQPRAVEERRLRSWSAAHWNGGIHYYYFAGGLTAAYDLTFTGVVSRDARNLEGTVKWLMGDPVRSEVQLSMGFDRGVADYRRFVAGLKELSPEDRVCRGGPPPTPIIPPPSGGKKEGIECTKKISSRTGLEIWIVRDLKTGRILTTPADRLRCEELQ